MKVEPQKEHAWLHRLIGEWTCEMESSMSPGKPTEKSTGKERVRSLGGLWVLAEGSGEMLGGDSAEMLTTLGFDPVKGRFVGTFVASMMTNLWVYEGTLAGDVLTLAAEGPSMSGDGTLAKYHDVHELIGNDRRTLTAFAVKDDGTRQQFMTVRYRRVG